MEKGERSQFLFGQAFGKQQNKQEQQNLFWKLAECLRKNRLKCQFFVDD